MPDAHASAPPPIVLSFDVEEHHRIEAAVGMTVSASLKRDYADRMERVTRQLLSQLAAADAVATFYIVGEIAESHPNLVRDIARAGHEIGSHGHVHQSVRRLTAAEFRRDLEQSRDALEQVAGVPVTGFRAPTFSVVRETAWAIDELADAGFTYDSSIFPVRHDRYGVPDAPRGPFWAAGWSQSLLELPPATWHFRGMNWPVAGGGYFRLLPLAALHAGVNQLTASGHPAILYFHPWEFDPDQPRLPLGRLSRWRTYVGINRTTRRLDQILQQYRGRFQTAAAVAAAASASELPTYQLAQPEATVTPGSLLANSGSVSAAKLRPRPGRSLRAGPSWVPEPPAAVGNHTAG